MDNISDRYYDMLSPLLVQLGWKGDKRGIEEALPRDRENFDLSAFRDTLVRLGYASKLTNRRDRASLPALIFDSQGFPHLVRDLQELRLMRSSTNEFLFFYPAAEPFISGSGASSLWQELRRFHPQLKHIILISLLIGMAGLAPIVYNRSIYDSIIGSGSSAGLPVLFAGVMIALVAEIFLRNIRNRQVGVLGARIDHVVSCSVFERLLFIPPVYTERTAVSAQISRLRSFENVREFFTGPLATLFFELPLIAVYLCVMAVLTGWMTLIPVVLLGGYFVIISSMGGRLRQTAQAAATSLSQNQEFQLETISKLRALRLAGMENVWLKRYHNISSAAALSGFRSAYTAQILETNSYVLMTLGGIATLGFGVVAVIDQTMSVGALIAAMMLVWRIIAPLQVCCASISRLQQLQSSIQQVRRLLSFAPEHNEYASSAPLSNLKGGISFHRVGLRYTQDTEPALMGVNVDIPPGRIVAIKGANGSGKSTILKVILGLYRPQSGTVRIDGIDLRQYDPVILRQQISYVPQNADFFPGTIRSNLLVANPAATEEEIITALRESCAYEEVMSLPAKMDTMIENDDNVTGSFLLRHRLNLARAYLRKTPIMLFDEASHSLGLENDQAFIKKINSLRGHTTVILVTHREDHMALADQLLVMDKGELTHAGPPEQILTSLKGYAS